MRVLKSTLLYKCLIALALAAAARHINRSSEWLRKTSEFQTFIEPSKFFNAETVVEITLENELAGFHVAFFKESMRAPSMSRLIELLPEIIREQTIPHKVSTSYKLVLKVLIENKTFTQDIYLSGPSSTVATTNFIHLLQEYSLRR
jgi:hypothetical protein